MNLKELYKKKIDEIPNTTFNRDQKRIAKDIIDKCDINDIQNVYNFVIQRVKLGFRFDSAPSYNNQSISLLKLNKDLSLTDLNKSQNPFDKNNLTNDNLLIIGENYDALKNLLITHRNRIDVIYIDPPYNTDASLNEKNNLSEEEVQWKDSSKFVYRDKFSRTGWLNLMQDRLILAKDLLTDDGVIFISIDDSEQAYLKVLLDEIFGEENFITSFHWQKKNEGSGDDSKNVKNIMEYILMFSKNINNIKLKKFTRNIDDGTYKFKDDNFKERGYYKLKQLDMASLTWSEKLDYELIIDGKKYYAGGNDYNNWIKRKENHAIKDWQWRWSKDKIDWGLENGFIEIKNEKIYSKQYQFVDNNLNKIKRESPFSNLILNNFISGSKGTEELKSIFNNIKVFDHPKPVDLIKFLINLIDKEEMIVLDFFAGSGTTAQSVLELNKEEKSNNYIKFIIITNNAKISGQEKHIAKDITYERLFRILKGEGTKGEKDFKWLKDNKPYKSNNLKVFDLLYFPVSIHDNLDPILEQAKESFRLLDNSFDIKDEEQLLNKLRSLHPYKKEGE